MTIYFVTRHPGAMDWANGQGFSVDVQLAHLEPESVQTGDCVIGSLPVNLAARICQRGGRYVHLSLELPFVLRGCELTAAEMTAFGAKLEGFSIHPGEPCKETS
ncbi:MAG: CRISPR-associated protein Csx16 [Magnetococcales bacterium]|nr:CRISPR-associated protein Csx16 [Magnetococcales bacterium]